MRRADLEDLDLRRWRLKVKHPKGEGSYAKKRDVTIPKIAQGPTQKFLKVRQEYLQERGFGLDGPLVPCIHYGCVKHYSSNAFRVIKAKVQEKSGVEFHLKDFRSTFAQTVLDHDTNLLQNVSRQLRHSTTNTTEKFYGRINPDKAFQGINNAMDEIYGRRPEN